MRAFNRTTNRVANVLVGASVVCAFAAIALSRPGGGPSTPRLRENGSTPCCADYDIECNKDGSTWPCPQDSDQAGYTVTLVTEGSPGQTNPLQTHAGSCYITRTTCGNTPNACDEVPTPVLRHCYNVIPSGANC